MAAETKEITPLQITLTVISLFIYPLIMFLLAGDWLWVEGWIFNIWFLMMSATVLIYLYYKDPALLAERFRKPGTGGEKGWDKYVIYGILILFIAWFIIMPLDARRFHWTAEFPQWLKTIGMFLLALCFFFFFRAFADNTFASPLVRIQAERHHRVVSGGVYGIVRHPMYLGAGFMLIGAPVLLSSLYGIGVGLLFMFLLMIRIVGEEKMLVNELEGYAEYRKKVRYRLIPFIW